MHWMRLTSSKKLLSERFTVLTSIASRHNNDGSANAGK
jgi:hypothetical protein